MIARESTDCRACGNPENHNITISQVRSGCFRNVYVAKRTFIFIKILCIAGEPAKSHLPDVGDATEKDTASMKMLLTGAVLAAVLTSPALAQTTNHHPDPAARYAPNSHREYIYPSDNHAHSANPTNDVYDVRGRYVGSDPDPFIRDYLARGHSQD
jgi:hypothetical protein